MKKVLLCLLAIVALLAVPTASFAASYSIACGQSASNSLSTRFDTYSFTLASRSRVSASFSTAFTGTYYIVQIDSFGADPTQGSGSNTATLDAGTHTLLFAYIESFGDPPSLPVNYNISLSCEPVATPVPTASPIPTAVPSPTVTPSPTVSPIPTATPVVTPTCNGACSPEFGFSCTLNCDTAVCGTLDGNDSWPGGNIPGDKYGVFSDPTRSKEFNLSLQSSDSGWQYVLLLFKDDETIPRLDAGAVGGNVARLNFTLPAGSTGWYVVVTYFDNGSFVPAWPKSYQLTALCNLGPTPTPTPAPLECRPESIFSQASNLEPQEGYAGTVSEKGQFTVFESFSNLPAAITGVRWWSMYLANFSSPCSKASTPSFEVSFYANENDLPGALVAGPFTLNSAGNPTGASFGAYPVTQFEIDLPRVDLRSGWISIVGLPDAGSPDCKHFWITAPRGDGRSIVRDGSTTFTQPYDSAFCLLGASSSSLVDTDFNGATSLNDRWEFAQQLPSPATEVRLRGTNENPYKIEVLADNTFGYLATKGSAATRVIPNAADSILFFSWRASADKFNAVDVPPIRLRASAGDGSTAATATFAEIGSNGNPTMPILVPSGGGINTLTSAIYVPAEVLDNTGGKGFVMAFDIVNFVKPAGVGTTFNVTDFVTQEVPVASLTGEAEIYSRDFSADTSDFSASTLPASAGGLEAITSTNGGLMVNPLGGIVYGSGGFGDPDPITGKFPGLSYAYGIWSGNLTGWTVAMGKIYRVDYTLTSTAASRDLSNQVRLRFRASGDYVYTTEISSAGSSRTQFPPDADGESYTSFVLFPDEQAGQNVRFFLDVYAVDPADSGAITLKSIRVRSYDKPNLPNTP